MREAERVLGGVVLALAPVLAFANGASPWDLVRILVFPAVITYLIGGIISGVIDAPPSRSIGVTATAAMAATLGSWAWTFGADAFNPDGLIFVSAVFFFVSAVALGTVFFLAYRLAAMAKHRILGSTDQNDAAL